MEKHYLAPPFGYVCFPALSCFSPQTSLQLLLHSRGQAVSDYKVLLYGSSLSIIFFILSQDEGVAASSPGDDAGLFDDESEHDDSENVTLESALQVGIETVLRNSNSHSQFYLYTRSIFYKGQSDFYLRRSRQV